ncbi:MAG: TolC family protein, partial [Acidobacteriota bacterium]
MGSDRFNRRRLQRLPGTAALALAVAMSLTVPQEGLAGQLADSGRSPASTLDAGAPFPPAAPARQADELRLTLAEAIRIAFDHNLDISVVDYDRRMARETVFSARGAFDPILQFGAPVGQGGGFGGGNTARSGGLGFVNSTQPTANQLAGANTLANTTFTSSANLGQTLPFGARYDVNYLITRGTSNSGFTSLNPSWNNVLTLSLTQPLLRGRGRAAGSSQLLLAQRNVEVSEEAFRDQVEAILLQVEQEYWEMVFAERNLSVAQQSLRLAQEQLERTHAQVEVGMLAPVQETQAEAAVAQRRSDL